jgi:hypothetical protein
MGGKCTELWVKRAEKTGHGKAYPGADSLSALGGISSGEAELLSGWRTKQTAPVCAAASVILYSFQSLAVAAQLTGHSSESSSGQRSSILQRAAAGRRSPAACLPSIKRESELERIDRNSTK